MSETLQFDPAKGWVTAIPEPFWFRHWLFWTRPGCYVCKLRFRNRQEWGEHYMEHHAGILGGQS